MYKVFHAEHTILAQGFQYPFQDLRLRPDLHAEPDFHHVCDSWSFLRVQDRLAGAEH
jgi:hypothetical protein